MGTRENEAPAGENGTRQALRSAGEAASDVTEIEPRARVALFQDKETDRLRIEPILSEAGFEVVVSCGSVDELIGGGLESGPELIVVVCELVLFQRPAVLDLVRAHFRDVPLVVVATGDAGPAERKALRVGVEGFVRAVDVERALVSTLDAVLVGQLCLPHSVRDRLARPVFSHREKQVLELLAQGFTNREIANRLHLSESTVKSHLASSFRKLGVSSRTEATRRMLDPGSGLDPCAIAVGVEGRSLLADLS